MGDTLHWYAETGQLDELRSRLASGDDPNALDEEGRAPIHIASERMRREIAGALIQAGADVNAAEHRNPGHRPLHLACRLVSRSEELPSPDFVRFLVEQGGDLKRDNELGQTPLHLATAWCNVDLLDFFLDHHAPVDATDEHGRTPVHVAVCRGSLTEAEALLFAEGASDDLLVPARREDSAMARLDDEDILRHLLDRGASAAASTDQGATPLHLSAERGTVWATRILIEYGADPSPRDTYRVTPLHRARSAEIAEVLLGAGAPLDAQDGEGNTALLRSIGAGRLEVSDVLLARGADVNAADAEGRTALHLAAVAGRAQTIERLIERGAKVNARDKEGRTPLFSAQATGHPHVISTLKRHGAVKRPKRFLFFDLK